MKVECQLPIMLWGQAALSGSLTHGGLSVSFLMELMLLVSSKVRLSRQVGTAVCWVCMYVRHVCASCRILTVITSLALDQVGCTLLELSHQTSLKLKMNLCTGYISSSPNAPVIKPARLIGTILRVPSLSLSLLPPFSRWEEGSSGRLSDYILKVYDFLKEAALERSSRITRSFALRRNFIRGKKKKKTP